MTGEATEARRLDGPGWTLVLAAEDDAPPALLWWGPPLPQDEDLAALAAAGRRPVAGGERDVAPPLALVAEPARGFEGRPSLDLSTPEGPIRTRLRGAFVEAPDGLAWEGEDGGVRARLDLRLAPGGALAIDLALTNRTGAPLRVHALDGPALALPAELAEVVDYSGRWCGEFRAERRPLGPGALVREGREGRGGHGDFPGAILMAPGASATRGSVLALSLAWSGGRRMTVETFPDGRRLIRLAATPPEGGEILAPGATLRAPTLHAARSFEGANGATAALHALVRALAGLPDPKRPRPVHFNSWEAVYFRHDLDELTDLAARAARLGAERFVLDDGWFRGRRHDRAGLGDWTVDPDVHPRGLAPLIDRVEALGLRFGLWVEPEMVNPDSDLHRAHPDWILGPADQPTGRWQLVLDLARPEVSDHLFAVLDALLRDHRIDYLKWDHNRALPHPDPAQTRALYALLDRLRAAHPAVEIESCASGGARIDYGILARARRVWLSDSNDALERLRIQHEAAAFLPPEIAGSHVGPRHCHTSGRTLSMSFRAWVAAQRAMGFEMDPRELTPEEEATLVEVVDWWKANRDWLHRGRLHRLDSLDPAVIAEMTVSAGGDRFVVFAGQAAASAGAPAPLRLTGLDPAARYRVTLRAPAEPPRVLNRLGHALEAPVALSGAALMGGALRPPGLFPETMLVLEGERLERP